MAQIFQDAGFRIFHRRHNLPAWLHAYVHKGNQWVFDLDGKLK
jgi:hypothetical protein